VAGGSQIANAWVAELALTRPERIRAERCRGLSVTTFDTIGGLSEALAGRSVGTSTADRPLLGSVSRQCGHTT